MSVVSDIRLAELRVYWKMELRELDLRDELEDGLHIQEHERRGFIADCLKLIEAEILRRREASGG